MSHGMGVPKLAGKPRRSSAVIATKVWLHWGDTMDECVGSQCRHLWLKLMFFAIVRHQPHSRCPHQEHENGLCSYPRDSLSARPHYLETEHLKATGSRIHRQRSQPLQPFLPANRFVRTFSPGKCKQAVQIQPDYPSLFFFFSPDILWEAFVRPQPQAPSALLKTCFPSW